MIDDIYKLIGSVVTVTVDRPLGTYHPKHNDIFYTINYGYVENLIALDNEEQDAYIIGVNEPVDKFTGKVIAVIHRLNDIEDKLVVAPENSEFTSEEILELVNFQEKFFEVKIITNDYSKER
ncbi:MAG: inorganic pyrophosphatase [Acutalibacteraceae bacterium]|nr:inorganic pyrophosphatase [Acutalibacteraceae bacterium]